MFNLSPKWNFPSNNHSQIIGIADSGVEMFKGTPIKSLAREICQNSLDARLDDSQPARIEFETFEMCNAPFRKMFALIVLDGDADLPQHLLVDLADCCSQRPNRGRGIEVKNRHKVLVLEVAFRLQTAAGHQGVGNTDGGRRFELDCDVEIIVLLQERTVNDVAKVLLMLTQYSLASFPATSVSCWARSSPAMP